MRGIAIGIVAAGICAAAETSNEATHSVTVCAENVRNQEIRYAAAGSARIFARIGIALDWHLNGPCPAQANPIWISFANAAVESSRTETLAYALPYEGTHIVVYYDRVRSWAADLPPNLVLAYVLAHEIGHILEGTTDHSPAGIMKARWNREDRFLMLRSSLRFAEDDRRGICSGLAVREARWRAKQVPIA